jgi:hypothetical protein
MMRNKNFGQSGLGHMAVLLVVVVIAIIGIVGWRVIENSAGKPSNQTANSSTPASENSPTDEPDVALHNLGLASLDSVVISQDAVREYADKGLKGFYPFGDKLGGKDDTRLNPNFEFSSMEAGTKLISPIDGVVTFIKQQSESSDYEVFVQPKNNSAWTIGFDHVTNLSVKKDAKIKVGDSIGEPSVQNNGQYRFEIQINKDSGGVTTHYCPSNLLIQSVRAKILGELTAMQTSWESTTGLELYDVAAQNPVGCIKKTMTSSEAEGM